MKKYFTFVFPLIIALLCLPEILPYFHKGYFPTHDGEWAVVRAADMFRTIKDGQIPARYSSFLNFGYGYPLFNFAYPLPYYLSVVVHFFKFSFVDSVKILFSISVVVSGLGMYLLSSYFWKNRFAGVVSSILYIYLPYRIVDLYVRGSLGESLAFALFPFIIYAILKIRDNASFYYSILLSVSLAALVTTHNIMTILFFPIILMFIILIFFEKKKSIIFQRLLLPFVGGISLSAFFWLPAILEKKLIALSLTPIADRNLYFVTFPQLFQNTWGYGTPTDVNGFSYQLGIIHVLLFLMITVVVFYKLNNKNFLYPRIFVVTIIVLTLCMFQFSWFVWKLPLLSEINYPWILLGPIGFLMSLFAGFSFEKKYLRYFAFVLCVFAIIIVVPHAKPKEYVDRGDSFYITNPATTTSSDELMPIWVKKKPRDFAANKLEVVSGKVSAISVKDKNTYKVDSQGQAILRLSIIDYPGWKVFINGKETTISHDNPSGLIEFKIGPGSHSVKSTFTETIARAIADGISLLAVCALIALPIAKTKILKAKF